MVPRQVEVLLIEDNPADAGLVRGHLSAVPHTQFNLQWVELLAEGLQAIERGGIDVVLLDLGLPDSEGLDTFQTVHAASPQLPVIVLTGLDDEVLALEAARIGAQDYLAKGQLDSGLLSRSIRYSIERKGAEEALRESEERFRELADMLPQMVFEIDENGVIAFLNQASFLTMGYTRDDITDDPMAVLGTLAPVDQDRANTNMVRALDGQSLDGVEYTAVRKDGSTLPVLVFTSPIVKDGKPAGLRGIAIDITERKRAEDALQLQEQYYRSLIENSADAITVLNADGSVRYVSPSARSITGLDPQKGIEENPFGSVHPDDIAKATDSFEKLMQDPGTIVRTVTRSQHADGSWLFIESTAQNLLHNPAVAGIVVNSRDITERKRAEEALKESEDKFRSLAEQSPNMIFMNQNGKVVYVNAECERRMGYGREEI